MGVNFWHPPRGANLTEQRRICVSCRHGSSACSSRSLAARTMASGFEREPPASNDAGPDGTPVPGAARSSFGARRDVVLCSEVTRELTPEASTCRVTLRAALHPEWRPL
jgi:hypothetical protein